MVEFRPMVSTDDIEVEPGIYIRDLTDIAACKRAVERLDFDISSIAAQIGRAEENPGSTLPGWRTKAQNAQRWKKRAIKAINIKMKEMAPAAPASKEDLRQAILDVIREDIGEDRMQAYVAIAKARLAPVDNGNNGEKGT
ncbi:hypothetical protein [Agrobacterium rubi]|uniref:Uncharacterized protein n=1 Tax=Agrobacterium rubi TaxID=28099 RepID=A0ABX2IXQ0_9HYPH|nr:hypothetical protein [Agrobacterium rubi]NTF35525.1 hypothetical protein [Agrobacterium rubi]